MARRKVTDFVSRVSNGFRKGFGHDWKVALLSQCYVSGFFFLSVKPYYY